MKVQPVARNVDVISFFVNAGFNLVGHIDLFQDFSNKNEDYDLILPAFLKIWNDPESYRFLSFTLQPFTEEIASFWFGNHLDQGGRYFSVIDGENTILGLLVIKINQIETFEIMGLAVRPEFKNQGIGSSLKHAIDLATEMNFRAADAGLFVDNTAMMRILVSYKFLPISIKHHARADGMDLLYMKNIFCLNF
ncbi:MAG: GNAT family N-acetyltransferase [Halobacteriota archaeon]|nr:GNAT family N-acetyltransferase [Halobacteriota archaeon]